MRKLGVLLLAILVCLCLILTACGSEPEPADETSEPTEQPVNVTEPAETDSTEADDTTGKDVLVVYFSATGTTKGVAEKIAKITGADIYEIIPAEPYTSDDLNYSDKESRTTYEQNDKTVRPEIAGDEISFEGYSTVYLGFPIWWGQEPRIMDTFAESHDFTGLTVIPFCTSGSSGIGNSGTNLEELAGTGNWLPGARHEGNISEEELQAWIDGLN